MGALRKSQPQAVTMTSLEIVDFINDLRKEEALVAGQSFPSEGFASLQHKDFLEKVAVVLGEKTSAEFSADLPDSYGRARRGYRFPKREASLMAMSYSYAIQARVWDHMTALEQSLAARAAVPAPVAARPLTRGQVSASILLLRAAAEDLKLAPSAVLGGYQRLEQQLGVTGLLPAYSVDAPSTSTAGSSEETKSAAELLMLHGAGIGAAAFNKLLMEHGFLEEHERRSSNGEPKKFKVCTDMEYGKNLTSPNNPRATQPHWYVSKFAELLDLVLPSRGQQTQGALL